MFEEPTLSSESHAGPPMRPPSLHHRTDGPARPAIPAQNRGPSGLHRFNSAPAGSAESALLGCCGSPRWARRLAAHRPYPDLTALLAACDEASYDLSPAELCQALAGEPASGPLHGRAPRAAHTALSAAHAAYESRFGHPFVICLDAFRPSEHLDQVLASIRSRLSHEPDEERAVAADELRRLARGRITRLVADTGHAGSPSVAV
ncbi:2-oxo-4-hydroxy-4-carboxy-5-ureidoimidazoline decarboxylase [Streptomyces sp. NBC_01020]|nr:2-oxo-4-hydroxy-4-carboxy-5-ureidoimidazoline decarboxylase [Streptomyces sp. NBC_01020]WSX44241.1 2-oxo-4-hydroxy-4-carboxy-5-ureidoimidazoline decarboxylase [Streptomyces sp. NBC_00963]WSX67742.1 2-oxo-4-hydroxy-4-carboxy-5-ureidoimidazoline decarboxylase [Streptomyces sp. NBC_00932]